MIPLTCFIDESGDVNLSIEKDKTSTFFIPTAVLVPTEKIKDVEGQLRDIEKNYNHSAKLRSKNISNDYSRRIRILKEVTNMPISFISLIIRKEGLETESGFQYPKSFYKFFSRSLISRVKLMNSCHRIVLDSFGRPNFYNELYKYLVNNNMIEEQTIFFPDIDYSSIYEFSMCNFHDEPLLSLPDFISGTLYHVLLADDVQYAKKLNVLLNTIRIECNYWPPEIEEHFPRIYIHGNYENEVIKSNINSIIDYLHQGMESEEEDIHSCISVLRYLKTKFDWDSGEYIKGEIIAEQSGISYDKFQRNVIPALRQKGIIIASCKQKGYKIPYNIEDVYEFINSYWSEIDPMLSRVKIAENRIRLYTNNQVDILSDMKFKKLKQIIDNNY